MKRHTTVDKTGELYHPPYATKAVILGCRGLVLSESEKKVYKKHLPFGLILFSRNCRNRTQLRSLVGEFRKCVGWHAPVFIDQEGGDNQRLLGLSERKAKQLKNIGEDVRGVSFEASWPSYPSMLEIGDLAEKNTRLGLHAAYLTGLALGSVLRDADITVNIAPVLDVLARSTHAVIGTRSFGDDLYLVAVLGRLVMHGLMSCGVLPVTKHIPGHGKAAADSHVTLPKVSTSYQQLMQEDFFPFAYNNDAPMAMVAHVAYSAIDALPATQSSAVIQQYIRKNLLTEAILITDCIFMDALKGTLPERAAACSNAGMEIICASHGTSKDKEEIASALPVISHSIRERYMRAVQKSVVMRENMLQSKQYDITNFAHIRKQLMKCFA